MAKEKRFGPKVRVDVKYECNGCQYHTVEDDEEFADKLHKCSSPQVVAEYSCPQVIACASVYSVANTPGWCPYRDAKD